MSNTPKTIRLADYRQPDYLINETHLHFELYDDHALVHAHLVLERNPQLGVDLPPLVLDGVKLELKHIALDDRVLEQGEYQVSAEACSYSQKRPNLPWIRCGLSRKTIPSWKVCIALAGCSAPSARPRVSARSPIIRIVQT